ncbi:hypothetical protein DFH06DRAFT_1412815 [Mycena polygramma]|nr:hypothetical protein DFH06DRAFT_1412815 [Mycena polygramma]
MGRGTRNSEAAEVSLRLQVGVLHDVRVVQWRFSFFSPLSLASTTSSAPSSSPSPRPQRPPRSTRSPLGPARAPRISGHPHKPHPRPRSQRSATGAATPSFFNFLDEDVKALDPLAMLSSAPYDFFGTSFLSGGGGGGSMDSSSSAEMSAMLGIDPSLVGSPAPASYSDFSDAHSTSPSDATSSPEESTTIAPVKVGGHGKARKGTVVGGGIKKSSSGAAVEQNTSTASTAFMRSTTFKPRANKGEDEDDEDDLPAHWRPPPEVFQKMSSKEKRQLRNKIRARNFRVRRKEYISTLEDNIAERDRLLSAIRAELGSTQSENLALRQEIAALKRTLLDNRGPAPVLPPPAPLSSPSLSSSSPSLSSSSSKEALSTPTLKDGALGGGYTSVHTAWIPELLGASPWAASPFASAEIPSTPHQQENLNPLLNGTKVTEVVRAGLGMGAATGANNAADGFGDANPFTVRSLDAYRMHLWGRMAAQYRHNKEHPASSNTSNSNSTSPNANANASPFSSGSASPFSNGATNGFNSASNNNASAFAPSPFFNPSVKAHSPPHSPPFPLSGLAGGLRLKYFSSPASGSGSNAGANANGLAASLAGLSLSSKGGVLQQQQQRQRESAREKERERESARERERESAMYAAMASQTLLKRLGGAFWDAFSGAGEKNPALGRGGGGRGGEGVGRGEGAEGVGGQGGGAGRGCGPAAAVAQDVAHREPEDVASGGEEAWAVPVDEDGGGVGGEHAELEFGEEVVWSSTTTFPFSFFSLSLWLFFLLSLRTLYILLTSSINPAPRRTTPRIFRSTSSLDSPISLSMSPLSSTLPRFSRGFDCRHLDKNTNTIWIHTIFYSGLA